MAHLSLWLLHLATSDVFFRNSTRVSWVVTEEFTERRDTFAEKKGNNILLHTFLKRQVKKTLNVLPWKLFTAAYKQQHLSSSQNTKACVHLKWEAVGKGASWHGVSEWWMSVVLEAMTGARKWERESKRSRRLGKTVSGAPARAHRATTGSAAKSSNTREERRSRLHVPAVSEHRKKEERKTVICHSANLQRKVSAEKETAKTTS